MHGQAKDEVSGVRKTKRDKISMLRLFRTISYSVSVPLIRSRSISISSSARKERKRTLGIVSPLRLIHIISYLLYYNI